MKTPTPRGLTYPQALALATDDDLCVSRAVPAWRTRWLTRLDGLRLFDDGAELDASALSEEDKAANDWCVV